MLRISKIVDYGVLVLTHMALHPTLVYSTTELAESLGLGQPTVSKILKLLTQHGLVDSTRGSRGGYSLSHDAGQINIAQVIDALEEQPFGLTECTALPGVCSVEAICHIRPHWQRINSIVRHTLEAVTIADMINDNLPPAIVPEPGVERLAVKNTELESVQMSTINDKLDSFLDREYEAGFVTEIESVTFEKGLDEDVIRRLSAIKREPEFMLEWRLKAYRIWLNMPQPKWAMVHFPEPDFQDISYYSAPKSKTDGPKSLDEVDPELLRTYEKLGVPLHERARLAGVAVDAVFDSVSVATTFRKQLAEAGVIFCSFSEAVREYPEIIQKYMGSVVPPGDNFYTALNSAVFSDGSFVFIPKGVKCPMELSTYFRINSADTGQFERTLIVAEEGASVSYLEGCTAPMRDENQMHAAVVELVALDDAKIKYSTVQNWYPGDENGVGGIYNFVTKRGDCRGPRSRISWTQVETGSAITWKYPSVILRGDDSTGEFYSVALSNHRQQADTGTKMIHMGRNTRSTIISKGISAGHGSNTFRSLVRMTPKAEGARNFTQCDSLLIGKKCAAHTFPTMEVQNPSAAVEHEATASRIAEDQLFYAMQRGLSAEDAVSMIVNGFCKEVIKELPMEFAVEAQNLLGLSLEGSVG